VENPATVELATDGSYIDSLTGLLSEQDINVNVTMDGGSQIR